MPSPASPQLPTPLIDADELAEALAGEHPPAVVDVRWELGRGVEHNRAAYLDGHLPGATFLDLESALSGPVAHDGVGGRHPMPAAERVQEAFEAAGISADRPVVFYDAARSLGAARAWWVARHHGLTASVLDGGLAAWQRAGHPVLSGEVEVGRGSVTLAEGDHELLSAADVVDRLARGEQVLDARPAERYRGENETIDPVAGHIPGALSVPALSVLDDDGRFRSAEELTGILTSAGADPSAPATVYCGSGVQAAHLALALEARGLTAGTPGVYVGSWSDWITDPARPVATGPEAG